MRKVYELWLDESGQFLEEKELQLKGKKPSLVGGILLEKERAEQIVYDELLDKKRNHAMHLTNEDKEFYVLPILEKLKETYHAKQVFFENAEYAEEESGRQLYLRVMAEGLLQLMMTLNAQSESVRLKVLIAQRQDVEAPTENRRILSGEYQTALSRLLEIKKKYHRMVLHEDSYLEFEVRAAHKEQKLQLADFACNTRLTRDSQAFVNVRERVAALHEDAYIFSLTEVSSENYIKRSLVEGCISDAIMELYTSRDVLDHKEQLALILQRMKYMDYCLMKVQLQQCIADVVAYAAGEDDYEIGEAFLQEIREELIPALAEEKLPYQKLKFAVLLQLSSMYLRQGDVLSAAEVLKECRQVKEKEGGSLEEVPDYLRLLEKEALLAVEEFDFTKGAAIMEQVCGSLQKMIKTVEQDETFGCMCTGFTSERLGEALGMQIYAMLFLQREKQELYAALRERSDYAMKQYPDEKGALERQRQYRSRMEAEQGNFVEAVKWLFLAKEYQSTSVTGDSLKEFLTLVCDTESLTSCQYYLMYYLTIMYEAAQQADSLAGLLLEALQAQERMLFLTGLCKRQQGETADKEIVDFSAVQEEDTDTIYHPMEIICWKYAACLFFEGKQKEALSYYKKATEICFAREEYLTMNVIGLGIEAERIYCLLKAGRREEAGEAQKLLSKRLYKLMHQRLPKGTKQFLKVWEEILMKKELPEEERYRIAARKMTY